MRALIVLCLSICFAVLGPAVMAGQDITTYRQRRGTREDRITFQQETQPGSIVLTVAISSGEFYRIEHDGSGAATASSFEFPPGRTSWVARRNGDTLMIDGTVQGLPVVRTFVIDNHPWYEAVELSLQSFAISGSEESVQFWIIEPYSCQAYLMAGHIEGRESIVVLGRSRDAVRVLVRPLGILSYFWSGTYWFDSHDGTFLRSQSVRWFQSPDPIVTEPMEDRPTAGKAPRQSE